MPRKFIIAGIVVVALLAAGLSLAFAGGSTSANSNEVVVFSRVQSRTLQDTVSLNGTLVRKQIRNVTAANEGVVSAVYATNDKAVRAAQAMFAINGRDAIAEDGTVPFFRSLQAGDQGQDVLQLKQILAAAGDDPGPMNNYFNQQTEYALAQWQAQQRYPNSSPANPESVSVSLEQSASYKVGAQGSAGLIIGPPPAQTTARTSGRAHAVLASDVTSVAPAATPGPVLTISALDSKVSQGAPIEYEISASSAPSSSLAVNLTTGGTAGPQDIENPPTSVTLPPGSTSAQVIVTTKTNTLIEPNPTVVLSIAPGSGYQVGTPSSALATIVDTNAPAMKITGTTTVTPGQTATLTITANQASYKNLQVILSVAGSAVAGTDYDPVNPVVTFPAGATSESVPVKTISTSVFAPNKFVVVSLSQAGGTYTVTTPAAAVVTIAGASGKPTLTLTSATTYLQKGSPFQVSIGLSQAQTTPLTVRLGYSGTAVPGTDYTVPAGNIVVPAGQTSLSVSVPTVTNNQVEPNRVLTVTLQPGTGYAVGTPNSATVTLASSVVPTLTITGTTTSVSQGGAASFVITASQAPVKNTSITFAVEGTAQPGQNYVPLTGTTLLAAGQTQVTVTLQSIQNNVVFQPTDMIVDHWPVRVGQVYVKAGAPVAIGEALLSLTEPNLSVTLQATAAERSKLEVGQHCTVEIAGENTSVAGVITELNSTPTTTTGSSGQSSQLYEGRIEAPELKGAEGSQVSITVVDQQVENALTVPISAVKQNGTGQDVVRVINLATGRITEVSVQTGITQGSYIQVTSGLRLGQVVIAQVDQ